MNVPFLELRPAYQELQAELDAAYARVMESGWYILGAEVEAFEAEFAAYCGVRHCIGVGNGLEALHLILRAAGIGPGDEVVVPSNTYIATWLAVTYAGARPVPVEPDPQTYNLDPDRIVAALTPRTRAILPVHLYGQPADMYAVRAVAEARDLLVIEDAAQAQGACYRGRPVGGLGHAAGFSFYPGKNLGAFGDAGAVTTNDDQLAERVRRLGNYGSRAKYYHDEPGFNSRLDPLQAAFLRVRLKHLEAWNERRRQLAARYAAGLRGVLGLTLPAAPAWAEPVWHIYAVLHDRRDDLAAHLRAAGIGTLIHYPVPPHQSGAYAALGLAAGSLPIAERLAATELSLPMGPHLGATQQDVVITAVRAWPGAEPGT